MSLPRFVSVFVIALTVFLPIAAVHAAETASCTFETFTAPPGYSLSAVNGIADDGTVVGQLVDNNTQALVAFTYSATGGFTRYSAPNSLSTWLYGRSPSGMNAGAYQASAYPSGMHGFLLQGSQFAAVNYPGAKNTWLFDVNQQGAAVGSFSASPTVTKGFLLANGTYSIIAYPGANFSYPQAISNNGLVAGYYLVGAVSYGFVWHNGDFTAINYPKAEYGTALVGINNSGVIVGNYFNGDFGFGFLYENGAFKKIVYSGAKYTTAGGINDSGVVSGQIFYSDTDSVGFTAACK